MMKAKVDVQVCNGCGFCARMVSGIFLIKDNGKAFALNIEIPVDYTELARVAAKECPRDAIILYDDRKRDSYLAYQVNRA
ncbi:MAG: ferredoxin [Clostridia bacterium]|nr:ferredoxin [Clostridia bacterium]